MATSEEYKRAAAYHAAEWLTSGMAVGLGTGSTVRYLLDALAERLERRELRDIVGVPTSEDTRRRAEALGIPLGDLRTHPRLDIAIDGADEVDPSLDLIKGLGGALLREKIVAVASSTFVVLVDESKRVHRLGTRAPVPVEVDPFGVAVQDEFLRTLGCEPTLRRIADGNAFHTDGGNLILDCHFPDGIADPTTLADALDRRVGVLEHGLFLGMASRVVVAGTTGLTVLERPAG